MKIASALGSAFQTTRFRRHSGGFSLIEILVALVVLSFGLLGVAALMVTTVKTNDSSTVRSQAAQLTNSIIDSMRANVEASTNGNHYYDTTSVAGTNYSTSCTTAGTACSSTQLADTDEMNWKALLPTILPSGDIAITTATDGTGYTTATITVYWDDSRATTGSTTANGTGVASTSITCPGTPPTGTNMCLTVQSLLK